MRIIGTTTTELTDGATTNPIVIGGNDYTAVAGDAILYGNITGEYLFNGTVWHLIGTGSSSSPFIVYCWDDFLKVNFNTYNVKFANPHEVDGTITLEGSGSQSNPYIVSSYEELIFATGASDIWKVKLVDRDKKLYQYRYIVDYAQPDEPIYADVFCRYDDSLSTINFNDIQPNGYTSSFNFSPTMNFNGWTLKNAVFHNYGCFYFKSTLSNAIFKDFYSDNTASTYSCIHCDAQASNIKMSGTFDTQGKAIFGVRSAYSSEYRGLINSSFDFKLLGKSYLFIDSGNSYTPKMGNCNVHFELIDNREAAVSLDNTIECYNCLFSGNIKAPNCTHSYGSIIRLMYSGSKYNIFNIKAEVEEGHNRPYLNMTGSNTFSNLNLYVNDGNVDYYIYEGSNIVGVLESTLKDARALYDLGLPIGVD